MFNKKDMKRNHKIIRKFCRVYRDELTIIGGVIGEKFTGLVDCDEYIEFMNQVSFDEFVGNYFVTLFNPAGIEMYGRILRGEDDIMSLVKLHDKEVKKEVKRRISEL